MEDLLVECIKCNESLVLGCFPICMGCNDSFDYCQDCIPAHNKMKLSGDECCICNDCLDNDDVDDICENALKEYDIRLLKPLLEKHKIKFGTIQKRKQRIQNEIKQYKMQMYNYQIKLRIAESELKELE
jgi:hypothetical protein